MGGRTLRSEELAGDVEGFAADDDDFLAVEQLLGDGAGEAAEEVAFAVYHNLYGVLVFMVFLLPSLPHPAHWHGCWASVTYHRLEARHLDEYGAVSRECRIG